MEHSASTRFQVRENVIRLAGEFDLCSAARLSEVLAEVLREGSRQLFIDVADVTFMDCSTLSVLLHARRASRRRGGDLCLVAVPARVRALLALTGTHGLVRP